MHWLAQLAVANMPASRIAQKVLQRGLGQLKHLENAQQFETAFDMLEQLEQADAQSSPSHKRRVLEVGTGWIPAVPVILTLAGYEVVTFDIHRHVTPRLFRQTLNVVRTRLDRIAECCGCSVELIQSRLDVMTSQKTLKAAMQALHGEYLAPMPSSQLPFAEQSFDAVVSNLVLQCVPARHLPNLIAETQRVLKPEAVAIHRMWLGDEYSVCDADRDPLHFLHYKETTWQRWFNHNLKHLNRWRASQFLNLFEDYGFEVEQSEQQIHQPSIELLQRIGVDETFEGMSWNEIATISLEVTLRKPSYVSFENTERDQKQLQSISD